MKRAILIILAALFAGLPPHPKGLIQLGLDDLVPVEGPVPGPSGD